MLGIVSISAVYWPNNIKNSFSTNSTYIILFRNVFFFKCWKLSLSQCLVLIKQFLPVLSIKIHCKFIIRTNDSVKSCVDNIKGNFLWNQLASFQNMFENKCHVWKQIQCYNWCQFHISRLKVFWNEIL